MLNEIEKNKLLQLLSGCILNSRNELASLANSDLPKDAKAKISQLYFIADSIHNIPRQILGKYDVSFEDTHKFLKSRVHAPENINKVDLSTVLESDS